MRVQSLICIVWLVFLLLNIGKGLNAQVNKVIEIPGASSQLASTMLNYFNDYVLYGAFIDSNNYQNIFLYRLNSNLEIVNFQNFYTQFVLNGYTKGLVNKSNSNILFLSRLQDSIGTVKTKLVEVDENFNIHWQRTYESINTSYLGGYYIIKHPDGGFVITGEIEESNFNNSDVFLLRIDSLGNELWRKIYLDPNQNNIALAPFHLINEEYFIPVGREKWYQSTLNSGYYHFSLVKLKADSTFIAKNFGRDWQLDVPMTQIIQLLDGNFIGVGSYSDGNDSFTQNNWMTKGRITKIDSSMNILFDTEIGYDYSYRAGLNFIEHSNSNGFFVGGGMSKNLNGLTEIPLAWLLRLDSTNNIIWERNYYYYSSISAKNIEFKILKNYENGFVLCGYASDNINPRKIWVVKTDSFGCVVPGCQMYDSVENPEEQLSMKLFPNPAQDFLNIFVPPGKDREDVRIYDSRGALVQSLRLLPAAATTMVYIRNLAPGLYFLSSDGEAIKFVKE